MPSARGKIRLPIGSLGEFDVKLEFGAIDEIERKLGPFGDLQRQILEFKFGYREAFTLLSIAIQHTEQERETPPDKVLQDELVDMGLTKATVLCMPVVMLGVDGSDALPDAQGALARELQEEDGGKGSTRSDSTLQ